MSRDYSNLDGAVLDPIFARFSSISTKDWNLDMAVQYAPMKLRVPPGFQNLLEGLAREVLREQPEDIINFAAQHFKNQLLIREGMLLLLATNRSV